MQATAKATMLIIVLFLLTQIIGFLILEGYRQKDFPFGLEPPLQGQKTSYVPLLIGLFFATGLALVIIHWNAIRLWQYWFLLSVFVCLLIAFAAFVPTIIALIGAILLSYGKVFRPNIWLQNITEPFMYGGLAAIFVPLLTLPTIMILLIIIALYDIIAVYKTRHMITLADFQRKTNLFVGFHITYAQEKVHHKLPTLANKDVRQVMLGGGDIGFPLLFTGVIYLQAGFIPAFIVSVCAAAGLLLLFSIAKTKKYYPAMPFVVTGCFIGYGLILLL